MKKILIADGSKASLVMTSEVFKDHFPGVQVVVARSSAECLELLKTTTDIDAFIVDFDLPDKDGAYTSARIKKVTSTPVLITAFDRPEVYQAIEDDLAPYDDCQNWLRKPVRSELLVAVAQRFCEGKYRTHRRLECAIPAVAEVMMKVTIQKTVALKRVVSAASKLKASVKLDPKAKSKKIETKPNKKQPPSKASHKETISKSKVAKVETKTKPNAKVPTKVQAKLDTKKAPNLLSSNEAKKLPKTEMITETIWQKTLVKASILDSSIGGIKIEIALPQVACKTFEMGEVLAVFGPPAELLEAGDKTLWSAWQKLRLAASSDKSAQKSMTEFESSKETRSNKMPVAASALKAKTKTSAALSTLAASTLRDTALKAKGTILEGSTNTVESDAWKTSVGIQLKSTICWVHSTKNAVFLGLRLDSINNARKIFDAALAHFDHGQKVRPTEAQMPSLNITMSLKMPQRSGSYHNPNKV